MPKNNQRKSYSKEQRRSSGTIWASVMKVLLLMFISGIVLLLIFACAISKTQSPLKLAGILSLVALYLGAFLGGIFSSASIDSPRSYIVSLLSSVMFAAVLFVIRGIISKSEVNVSISESIFLHILIVASSLLGVLIAEKHRSKRKRRR